MLALGANGRGRAGLFSALRPQDVFQILTQPANQMQAAINALPFSPDILIDKDRVAAGDWSWRDTARGLGQTLASNTTAAETAWPGYSGTNNRVVYALKQQAKVAVRVPYTGDGTSGRVIPHALGIKPGMIIIRQRNTTGNWFVYHASLGASQGLALNSTAAAGASSNHPAEPTATGFTIDGSAGVNQSGGTYVAYLFAHDPDTTNGIVQCGSFTAASGGNAVTLGWQPQWLLMKDATASGTIWVLLDTARGWGGGNDAVLAPNSSGSEGTTIDFGAPTATGFTVPSGTFTTGDNVVFLAIRAPI